MNYLTARAIGLIAAVAAFVVLVIVAWWLLTEPGRQRAKAVQAHAAAVQADARSQAATDAIGVITNTTTADQATDATTRENTRAIQAAPGAAAPVDPGVSDAGLRSLCRRAAYRAAPRCKLLDAHP